MHIARIVRYCLRNPAYAVTAILSLAIGIGANSAMFSVVNTLLLQPLPYQDADRLAILWNRSPGLNIAEDWFSTAQYFDIRNGHSGFEQTAIAIGGTNNLTGNGEPERVGTIRVSSNLLPLLGIKAALGRTFVADEDSPGRPPSAILSYGMWSRRYGADPRMVGRSIRINGQPFEVVGVLPQSFSLPREVLPTLGGAEQAEILLPLPLAPNAAQDRDHEDYNIVGKLKRGVSVAQAQAEMDTITARLRRDFPALYPPNGGLTFSIVPLRDQVVGETRRPLFILMGAVGFVLLIACANVANLALSRVIARAKDIAIRTALGATRWQLARDLLAESLALALAGGTLGILLCLAILRGIRALGPKSVPRVDQLDVDSTVLFFTILISVAAGLLFGVLPAMRASSTISIRKGGNHLRRLLVVAELALSVMLLIGAGLLIRSFARLSNVNPGFNPRGVLTLGLTMSGHKYDSPKLVLDTYRQLWDRLERLPGAKAAGGVTSLPLTQSFAWGPITVDGRPMPAGQQFINADQRMVGGHYFEAMEIPLIRGRLFNEHDTADSPRVTVIDEFMARELWPGQDAVGKTIHVGPRVVTVVGVVGRVKQYALDADSRIALYLPQTQFTVRALSVVLRSSTDLAAAVKSEIQALDPDLPVYYLRTMQQRVDESLSRQRFAMVMLAAFAAVALLLAVIGIYGVMSYLVSQGTREIGIRMALGASRHGIAGMVVQRGVTLAMWGVAVGLAGAAILTRLMRALLFGVEPLDVPTYLAVSAVLLCVTVLACALPAHRAASVDPMVSLRWE